MTVAAVAAIGRASTSTSGIISIAAGSIGDSRSRDAVACSHTARRAAVYAVVACSVGADGTTAAAAA
tara:strand:- start:478 stop:678 length:201 start_codon:yes stop_codon:yes gene_type:complete